MSEVAPTEEAVSALLDYLVDPLLPLKAHGKDPPSLAHQQSVAKQMHAVVLLYNYYHRKQHPELYFLEPVSFCKLALTLKPALTAHMKIMHQTDSICLNDLENRLSVAEKAVMDACKISVSLDALKDVPSIEGWPISKVSVFLVDSEKENCVLLYDSITNGVWSIIEKSIDDSDVDLGNTSKRIKLSQSTTGEQLTESYFEQLAFTAVKEATGINHSDIMVLERHVVYSLSKEKTAAYFYIMQCTSGGDIQVPIRDTIEREFSSNSLQRSNDSSIPKTEEDFGERFSEREQVTSNGLQNVIVELRNIEVNSYLMLENTCHAEANNEGQSNDGDCNSGKYLVNEKAVTEKSKMMDEEAQETEQSDKSWDITHPTVKQLENCIGAICNGKDTISAENCNRADKEVLETEKHDGKCENAQFRGNVTVAPDKFKMETEEAQEPEQSDKFLDINDATEKELENCSGEDTTGTDNSKTAETEVKERGRLGALLDISHSTIKNLESCVRIDCIGEESSGSDNTKRVEKKVEGTEKSDTGELTYSPGNSSDKHTIDADNNKEIKKVIKETEKSDKSSDTMNNEDSEASKQGPPNEHKISYFLPRKRQKMDDDGVIMSFTKNGDKNKSADSPVRVYHHQKRKIPVKSAACASVGGATNVESAGSPKLNRSNGREGKISGNGINWTLPYNLNCTQVEDSASVCLEPNARSVETQQATLGIKNIALAQTALGHFFRKRAKLCHQVRFMLDEIASCDQNIQKILEGNEDALALMLDAIMDGCNDACFKDKYQHESYQHGGDRRLNQLRTTKRISDAIFNLRSPTQDLNDICDVNNWTVNHSVSAPDGGFLAKVTVQGMDFDCSCSSELLSTPEEARDSAAARMIAQLRAMAGHT